MVKLNSLFQIKSIKMLFVLGIFILAGLKFANANNLIIGTPTYNYTTSQTVATLTFTCQWDNSWYVTTGPTNYDGVWCFVKFQDCSGDRQWYHCDLSTNSALMSVTGSPTYLTFSEPNDHKGIYLYRSSANQGTTGLHTVILALSGLNSNAGIQSVPGGWQNAYGTTSIPLVAGLTITSRYMV